MMHFTALATDYDGTLATYGSVIEPTLDALAAFRAAGKKLLLVTGRELPELKEVFPRVAEFFDCVVAENGALLYWPQTGEERVLSEPAPERFVSALKAARIEPISFGRVIIATKRPYEEVIYKAMQELKVDWNVIFNKESVMVLPNGVNKAFGLRAALATMGIAQNQVVGVGDAENDLPFLESCGFVAAVANGLEVLKRRAHWVTPSEQGAGVVELMNRIVKGDLREVGVRVAAAG